MGLLSKAKPTSAIVHRTKITYVGKGMSLLDLSPEIRNTIYAFIFPTNTDTFALMGLKHAHPNYRKDHRSSISILLVNHQIYAEAIGFLYRNAIFFIWKTGRTSLKCYRSSLTTFGPCNCTSIRRLRIQLDLCHPGRRSRRRFYFPVWPQWRWHDIIGAGRKRSNFEKTLLYVEVLAEARRSSSASATRTMTTGKRGWFGLAKGCSRRTLNATSVTEEENGCKKLELDELWIVIHDCNPVLSSFANLHEQFIYWEDHVKPKVDVLLSRVCADKVWLTPATTQLDHHISNYDWWS